MTRFLVVLWRILTFPIRLVLYVVKLPIRLIVFIVAVPVWCIIKMRWLLNYETEDRPLIDSFASVVTDSEARQWFWSEIEAFRMHLLRSTAFLALMTLASFIYTEQVIEFLAAPIGGLNHLKAIEVTESVGVFMRVALMCGIAVATPYIAFEFWLFAALGGLTPREKKLGLLGIPLATIFFIGGMAFTYYLMLPTALPFLTDFMGIKAELRPHSYFSFVTGLMFWIGLMFEFPLVIYMLTAIGLVKPKVLAEQWRLSIVLSSVIAAAITPTVDPVNMGLVMIPMVLLYFLSIAFSYVAYAGRLKEKARAEAKALEAK